MNKDQIIMFSYLGENPLFTTTRFEKPRVTLEDLEKVIKEHFEDYLGFPINGIEWNETKHAFMVKFDKGFKFVDWTWITNYE